MTRILFDTHAFLWSRLSPDRLGQARALLENPDTTLLLSAVSSWEIAIKWSLGKLDLPEPPSRYIPARMQLDSLQGLPVEHSHALAVAELPHLHRDPFDRLLVAQAIAENVRIATADPAIRQYDPPILWLGAPDQSR